MKSKEETVILTVGCEGLRGFVVSVETKIRRGLFHFDIVGLASKSVSESKQRILSAVQNCASTPKSFHKKIVTLLSPADEKKEGAHFDLPIAVSYMLELASSPLSRRNIDFLRKTVFIGELSLSGSVRPIKNPGILMRIAEENGITHAVVPAENKEEVAEHSRLKVWAVGHLSEVSEVLTEGNISEHAPMAFERNFLNRTQTETERGKEGAAPQETGRKNFLIDSIEGNNLGKRALQIALAGKHHIVFVGEPGTGKSLLAKAAKELVPHQHRDQPGATWRAAENFREPHHTSSYSDLMGTKKSVGEVALSDGGILFLDELVEYDRRTLEALRQPLESRYVQHKELGIIPADFIMIGSMNPCGCGYAFTRGKRCFCSKMQIERYERKIKSPLFERIDIKVNFRADAGRNKMLKKQLSPGGGEGKKPLSKARSDDAKIKTLDKLSGGHIRNSVSKVREIQHQRYKTAAFALGIAEGDTLRHSKEIHIRIASDTRNGLSPDSRRIFEESIDGMSLSRRSEHSVLLVARTIADIEEYKEIAPEHVLEALSYRNF